jgi:hypothetical protein
MEQKMRDSLPLLHFSSCTGVPQDSELLERHGTAKSDVLSKCISPIPMYLQGTTLRERVNSNLLHRRENAVPFLPSFP